MGEGSLAQQIERQVRETRGRGDWDTAVSGDGVSGDGVRDVHYLFYVLLPCCRYSVFTI